jgi:hypothetical protein
MIYCVGKYVRNFVLGRQDYLSQGILKFKITKVLSISFVKKIYVQDHVMSLLILHPD